MSLKEVIEVYPALLTIPTLKYWVQVFATVQGSGRRVQGAGCVQGSGFRVPGAGCVQGSGCRVHGVLRYTPVDFGAETSFNLQRLNALAPAHASEPGAVIEVYLLFYSLRSSLELSDTHVYEP